MRAGVVAEPKFGGAHGWIGLAKFLSAGARKPKPMSRRPYGYLLATTLFSAGSLSSVSPSCISRRRRSGRLDAPEPGGQPELSLRISFSALLCAARDADEARAAAQAGLALDPCSPSAASWPVRATIRLFLPDANASVRACAWPVCRRGDVRSGFTGAAHTSTVCQIARRRNPTIAGVRGYDRGSVASCRDVISFSGRVTIRLQLLPEQ